MTGPAAAVLHLTLANPKPGLGDAEVEALVEAFGGLGVLPGVLSLGAVLAGHEGSTHALGLFVYLRDRAALEAFGTDRRHIEFVRGALVGAVSELATADAHVSTLPPPRSATAACFAARFRAETFDWEVRQVLERLAGPLTVSGGPSEEAGQGFRTAGVAFPAGSAPPEAALAAFRRRWQEAGVPPLAEVAFVIGDVRLLSAGAPLAEGVD